MQLLAPLAGLLGIEVDLFVQRLRQSALVWGLIGLSSLLTLVFGLVALDLWLATLIGPILAPLAIAGAFLVLALVFSLALAVSRGRQEKARTLRKRSNEGTALVTSAALTALPMLIGNSGLRRVGLPVGALAATLLLLRSEGRDRD